jgi:hypothetical protein
MFIKQACNAWSIKDILIHGKICIHAYITLCVLAIRYVLVFSIIVFFQGSLYILPIMYMYIFRPLTLR